MVSDATARPFESLRERATLAHFHPSVRIYKEDYATAKSSIFR